MRFSEETAFFGFILSGLFAVVLFGMGFTYHNDQQIRATYQTAYQKNMDCRMASQKSGFSVSVERICGPIPKFEDYQND
jgi:hypothetical protein